MPNAKVLSEKQAIVAELTEKLKTASSGVLVDYKGITVAQDTALRAECRKNELDYAVVKNTLVRFAINNVGLEEMDSVLNVAFRNMSAQVCTIDKGKTKLIHKGMQLGFVCNFYGSKRLRCLLAAVKRRDHVNFCRWINYL